MQKTDIQNQRYVIISRRGCVPYGIESYPIDFGREIDFQDIDESKLEEKLRQEFGNIRKKMEDEHDKWKDAFVFYVPAGSSEITGKYLFEPFHNPSQFGTHKRFNVQRLNNLREVIDYFSVRSVHYKAQGENYWKLLLKAKKEL
jgi:hypothetical protein